MDTAHAGRLLTALDPGPPFRSELGVDGDVSFLRLSNDAPDGRWAVINSPGDRWFSVDTDGGFSFIHVEEDSADDFVADLLEEYVAIGVAYLSGQSNVVRRGRFHVEVLVVNVDGKAYELQRSVVANIKAFFRRR
jgi:hypothetical protein